MTANNDTTDKPACSAAALASLTPRALVDGEALGFALFIGDMRETDNRATREAWAQMEPEPKAEYVSRALALHAIGYAAGRSEGEAERVRATQEGIDIGRARGWKEANVEIDRLVASRAAERDATIARLTAERDAARSEAHASAGALLAPKIELATMGLRDELAEARAAVRELEDRLIDYSASWSVMSSWLDCREGDDAQRPGERPGVHARRMVEAARLDGAQKERRLCLADIATIQRAPHSEYSGAIRVLGQAIDAIRARGDATPVEGKDGAT